VLEYSLAGVGIDIGGSLIKFQAAIGLCARLAHPQLIPRIRVKLSSAVTTVAASREEYKEAQKRRKIHH
jgi:hypothetical protein